MAHETLDSDRSDPHDRESGALDIAPPAGALIDHRARGLPVRVGAVAWIRAALARSPVAVRTNGTIDQLALAFVDSDRRALLRSDLRGE